MNIVDFIFENACDEHIALVDRAEKVSYGDLQQRLEGVASLLKKEGVQLQDRVGVLVRNRPWWVYSYLGVLKSGGVVVPLSRTIIPSIFARCLRKTQCRVLIIDEFHYKLYKDCIPAEVILLIKANGIAIIRNQQPMEMGNPEVPRNLAALMFTSGSTGTPKAVMITHENIRANTESIISYLDLTSADKVFTSLPLHYCFGTSLLHTHLRAGGTIIFNSYRKIKKTMEYVIASGANALAGVPSSFQIMLRSTLVNRYDFSQIKKIQQAGGRLAPVFIEELSYQFNQADIYVMYGQTEATARLSYLPPEYLNKKRGSIGKGIPGCELAVLSKENKIVQPMEIGEIIAKGANMSQGYWQDPVETQKLFTDNGWLRTGDIGYRDENGFCYIIGREKTFIKSGGYRCSEYLIEDYLLRHPQLVEVGIIGTPDVIRGEAICAFMSVQKGTPPLSKKEVIQYCKKELPNYMIPKHITFVDDLPKTNSGKVSKPSLQAMWANRER